MSDWECLQAALAQGPVCLVEVVAAQGSVPRGPGAWMAVLPSQTPSAPAAVQPWLGTIGGGHLEWEAMRLAQQCLQRASESALVPVPAPQLHRLALGPSLGQCCGGAVEIRLTVLTAAMLPAVLGRLQPVRWPVALFGAGHVGHALVRALQPLPFAVHWVDSREDMLPTHPPAHVDCEHSEPVQDAVRTLPAQSLVLVMSFSHAEDLDIVSACLRRQRAQADLPFVGLIGSDTKWAVFQKRLAERGFSAAEIAHITCPIGLPSIPGKEPAVIALSVAAQLLQQREARLQL